MTKLKKSLPMLILIIEKGGSVTRKFKVDKPSTVIGRVSGCDIALPFSHQISRRHAKIEFKNNQYYLVDLNSSNGTLLNGRRITAGEEYVLKPEDRITIADEVRLRVEIDLSGQQARVDFRLNDHETIENTSRIFSASEVLSAVEDESTEAERQMKDALIQVKNKSKLLQILNRVEKELIAIRPIDEYLKLVMDLVFEMIPADRGFLMLKNIDSGTLEAKQVKFRQDVVMDSRQLIQISRTITQKVMQENVAIITPDAIIDDRFSDGESIFDIGIRSVMCVPLWNKENVLGIIYVDNLASSGTFDDDDLALLIAFANHAAIGIEQARLHEHILVESKIRDRLERYHSPEIVEWIIKKEEAQIAADEADVTVLFADIVEFSSMIEMMEPFEVFDVLNEFFSMSTSAIFRHGGTLDKFIGDNVMAIFGAPISAKDDAYRAVRCALEIRDGVSQLNVGKPFHHQIRLRIGINSGKVIVGDFGSTQRMEYTVLGETVNTASRIESQLAKPGQIFVGERTYTLTKDDFDYDYRGEFEIKGKKNKIKVYVVNQALNDLNIY